MVIAASVQLDPVKYEMFLHRLWAIGEEGRTSLQRVTASPIVSQGGECMSSFYDPTGEMILACSGHLRFAAATSDAIKMLIEWYAASPGFHDGDQLFFNDPYIAGAHTYDMMIVKPMFWEGSLIGWLASSIHTADTGGVMRGLATEIYHEGIRIQGLKVVEKGEFREDVFRCLTEQCRDPGYVGLDMKSMIASNNVCAKRYLELVGKFGLDFIQNAGRKIIEDSDRLARAKLRDLPDGTWTSRVYGTAWDRVGGGVRPYAAVCAMTKNDDELYFDFTGSSPQMNDTTNSTLAGTEAQLAVALTDFLFWDVPWSDGKFHPVHTYVPEGSILNCRFPAACGAAPGVGVSAKIAASECIAKMLYAGGLQEDINAPWQGIWYSGGPGFFYGGHNREGLVTAQGLYDGHGAGLGATPERDGVHCGGNMNIPSGGTSDVERIEMQYPFIYFTRNLHRGRRRAGQVCGRRREQPHLHDIRVEGQHGQLQSLRLHSRERGPVRRLSHRPRRDPGRLPHRGRFDHGAHQGGAVPPVAGATGIGGVGQGCPPREGRGAGAAAGVLHRGRLRCRRKRLRRPVGPGSVEGRQ